MREKEREKMSTETHRMIPEYTAQIVTGDPKGYLNRMALVGWVLVTVDNDMYFMTRMVEERSHPAQKESKFHASQALATFRGVTHSGVADNRTNLPKRRTRFPLSLPVAQTCHRPERSAGPHRQMRRDQLADKVYITGKQFSALEFDDVFHAVMMAQKKTGVQLFR